MNTKSSASSTGTLAAAAAALLAVWSHPSLERCGSCAGGASVALSWRSLCLSVRAPADVPTRLAEEGSALMLGVGMLLLTLLLTTLLPQPDEAAVCDSDGGRRKHS